MYIDLKRFLGLIFLILILSAASASFQAGEEDYSIGTRYGPFTNITGWINISLSNEPATAILRSSEGDEISLLDFLELNNANYDCMPANCGTDYQTGTAEIEENLNLGVNNQTTIGFKISGGTVNSLSGFSMTIESHAGQATSPQLLIDILDNGINEWQPYSVTGTFGSAKYGCFYPDSVIGQAEIVQETKYCEQITLAQTPNIEIGAVVEEVPGRGGSADFKLEIYSKDYVDYGFCQVSTSGSGTISCSPEGFKTSEEKDFFICISSSSYSDNNKYQIDYEENLTCGFSGDYNNEFYMDFPIFVKPGVYGEIGTFILNNTELEKAGSYMNIENEIVSYIFEKYGGDCTYDCIVPIKFTSGVDSQDITISNVALSYTTRIAQTTREIYSLQEIPAKVSSQYLKLNLDEAGFRAPEEKGSHSFFIRLDGFEILSEEINVEEVTTIQGLVPMTAAAAFPTTFTVVVESPNNISVIKYEWDFGDNNTGQTEISSVEHTYRAIGEYDLKLTITDEDQLTSSKTFVINVSSPEATIENALTKLQDDLTNVKKDIGRFDPFTQDNLNSLLDITSLNDNLGQLQKSFRTANSDQEYAIIIGGLSDLVIPISVIKDMSAESLLFYPKEEHIDFNILETIGGGSYDSNNYDEYFNALLFWNRENLEARLTFKRLSVKYEDYKEPLLSVFELDIKEKGEVKNPYLIIQNLGGLTFKEDYSEREEEGYTYIELRTLPQTIIFSTTEALDFVDLPLFIAPELDKLPVFFGDFEDSEERGSRWTSTMTTLIIILIALLGISTYLVLNAYKKKLRKSGKIGPKEKISLRDILIGKVFGKLEKKGRDYPDWGRSPTHPRRSHHRYPPRRRLDRY